MTRKERIPWYERFYGLDRLVHISVQAFLTRRGGSGERWGRLVSYPSTDFARHCVAALDAMSKSPPLR